MGDLVQQYLAAGIKLRNYLHARQVPQVTLMVVEATVGTNPGCLKINIFSQEENLFRERVNVTKLSLAAQCMSTILKGVGIRKGNIGTPSFFSSIRRVRIGE